MTDKPADVVCEGDVCRRVTPEEAAASSLAASASAPPRVFSVLGDSLLGKDGKAVPISSITGPNKIIAIYFSAHWCPPCRFFTPQLASIYKKFKASHARAADWEVVFVSSDRDQASFDEYFAEMPWLALSFENRDAKAQLSKLYKVRGIPTLVIVDGETGELITANGRDAVGDDEDCESFPWRPKTFRQVMEGATLVEPGPAAPVNALEHLSGKVTLLYFSASWCPPCRRFTPKLVETMAALRAAGKAVEAVFISGDREAGAMEEYHSHMTWPALPFSDRKRANDLNMRFEVEGIPTLVVLDESFNVITTEGVGAVASDPQGARFPWIRQPLEPLSDYNVSSINSGPALLYVSNAADAAAAEAAATAALGSLAKATREGPDGADWAFLWGLAGDALVERVLKFVGGAKEVGGCRTVLMDVAGGQQSFDLGSQGVEMSPEGLSKALADFKAGTLGGARPLGAGDDDDDDDE